MGKTADSTEHTPQGEVRPICNGDPETRGEMETQKNPQQEKFLMEVPSRNGDATRERDPGCLAPVRKPIVWGTVAFLLIVGLVAALAGEFPACLAASVLPIQLHVLPSQPL
ncbi:hypothetical protein KIL84_004287 [Mauremys mutica]|uniref:Uncharacterized protein n=1 Tax=Mauremys mutica TaxID=74926 RepID=A0A9D3XPF1_9SAUR|nr:hypothetical protein KIL84_004287 [Mauremys mutica]